MFSYLTAETGRTDQPVFSAVYKDDQKYGNMPGKVLRIANESLEQLTSYYTKLVTSTTM